MTKELNEKQDKPKIKDYWSKKKRIGIHLLFIAIFLILFIFVI